MAQSETRIFGLDLLRSIAIVLVVFTHSSPILSPVVFYKASVYTGFLGVELFFVLSGFLIGTILLKINQRVHSLQFKDVKIFWIRRWFRTLPNYYLMFFVYAAAFFVSHHIDVLAHARYLSYLVFLQNTFSAQPNDFFPIAWSLSVEEWFYLLFPLLLLVLSKILKGAKGKSFLSAVMGIMIIELIVRMGVSMWLANHWDEGYRKLMPLRLDSIDIGVLAACFRFYRPVFWEQRAKLLFAAGVTSLAALSAYLYFTYINYSDPVFWDHKIKSNLFLNTIFFTLTSCSVALAIPYLCRLKIKNGTFTRIVTFLSKISYSMYLTHFLIILVLERIFKQFPGSWSLNIVLFISVWVATIFISGLQYRYFELKTTSLRDRISKTQAAIKI